MAGMRLDVLSLLLSIEFYQGDVLDEGSFSAEELGDDELSKMEDCRPVCLCSNKLTEMTSRAFTSMTRHRLVMFCCLVRKNPNSEASFPPHANRSPAAITAIRLTLPSTQPA